MRQTSIFLACIWISIGCGEDTGASDADSDSETEQEETDAGEDAGDSDDINLPEYEQEGADLFWLYCLAGQTYEDGCSGEALVLTWEQALDACSDGYRLPTLDELMAFLGECQRGFDESVGETATCLPCPSSQHCGEAYPGTENLDDMSYEIHHWSSTEWSTVESNAWRANFKTGEIDAHAKTKEATAVCVRSE